MKKKELAIIICLLIIEIISLFLMYKSSNNNEEYIFEINSTEEINYNNIAIMIEKKDGTGYEESTTNKWPTNMEFNNELSGCVDKNGNRIEEALSYENGIAKVNTSTTSYCYLFFDNIETDEPEVTPDEKIGLCTANDKLGECLYNSRTNIASLSDNLEGGLYRYQGTNEIVNDNYVCWN